jgi:hypothetical protein
MAQAVKMRQTALYGHPLIFKFVVAEQRHPLSSGNSRTKLPPASLLGSKQNSTARRRSRLRVRRRFWLPRPRVAAYDS